MFSMQKQAQKCVHVVHILQRCLERGPSGSQRSIMFWLLKSKKEGRIAILLHSVSTVGNYFFLFLLSCSILCFVTLIENVGKGESISQNQS